MTTHLNRTLSFGVIILAAGRSRRMGEPKLLLPWGTTTILGQLIRAWEQLSAAQITVVGAGDNLALREELDRLGFAAENRILNPAPDRGMFSSIQCAAAWPGWKPELTHWIITLGDQPHVRPGTLKLLLDFAATNPQKICQPLRAGHRKHPVCLPEQTFAGLKGSAAADLKQFLAGSAGALAGFESDDAGLDLDIDCPEDYERAKRICFEEAGTNR